MNDTETAAADEDLARAEDITCAWGAQLPSARFAIVDNQAYLNVTPAELAALVHQVLTGQLR